MDREVKLIKDRECIHCERFWDCKGKPENTKCVSFTERKEKMGLVEIKREITKEKYEKIMEKNGFVSDNDSEIFADWEIWGYGVYGAKAIEEDGKFYVKFERGSSCD